MLLAIDIGNTSISFGVYRRKRLISDWKIFTSREKTADEYGMEILNCMRLRRIRKGEISAIAISCVVPVLLPVFRKVCTRYFRLEPLIVSGECDLGLRILYENPRQVGADRICASVAGYHIYGGPVIIIDFGTATTFDVVNENGEYLGGVIAPGVGISSQALFEKAAQLPQVELVKPGVVIGKNTERSMQAGLYYGTVGQVKEIVEKIQKELGNIAKVVITGGYADFIRDELSVVYAVNETLVLEGLRIIWERMKNKKKRGCEYWG